MSNPEQRPPVTNQEGDKKPINTNDPEIRDAIRDAIDALDMPFGGDEKITKESQE